MSFFPGKIIHDFAGQRDVGKIKEELAKGASIGKQATVDDIASAVTSGLRLPLPNGTPAALVECWLADPTQRPDVGAIVDALKAFGDSLAIESKACSLLLYLSLSCLRRLTRISHRRSCRSRSHAMRCWRASARNCCNRSRTQRPSSKRAPSQLQRSRYPRIPALQPRQPEAKVTTAEPSVRAALAALDSAVIPALTQQGGDAVARKVIALADTLRLKSAARARACTERDSSFACQVATLQTCHRAVSWSDVEPQSRGERDARVHGQELVAHDWYHGQELVAHDWYMYARAKTREIDGNCNCKHERTAARSRRTASRARHAFGARRASYRRLVRALNWQQSSDM